MKRRSGFGVPFLFVQAGGGVCPREADEFSWQLRWNSKLYEVEAANTRAGTQTLRPIDDVAQLISETAPSDLPSQPSNRVMDLICWYARWTSQLQVAPELWKEAERDARELLRRGDQWPIYAGTADE